MLSIIIPAHNEEQVIKKTLKKLTSYLNDTNITYEIIVICDACTDHTAEKAKAFTKVKTWEVNYKTASLTRNKGAQEASGDYLLFLDADTAIVNENTIEKSIELLNNPHIKVIGSYWSSNETPDGTYVYSFLTNWFLYFTNTCPGFYLFCRRKEFIPFRADDKNEDIVWCKDMCQHGGLCYLMKNGEVHTSMRRLEKHGLLNTMQFYMSDQSVDMFVKVMINIILIIIIISVIIYGNLYIG